MTAGASGLGHPLFGELRRALAGREIRRLGPLPEAVLPASVLVPFFVKGGEVHLQFIKRPEGNYRHAGQIAFPGGKRDPGDADDIACALREANEEVGLHPADVLLLGRLDEYDTLVSGFRVSPVVGAVPWPYDFRPAPREIERIIEVPLRLLLDPARQRTETRDRVGLPRTLHYISVGDVEIWGVTAAILLPLLEMIRTLPSAPGLR